MVWLYHYGYFPKNQIDHIDRNPSNNKVENLREATQSQNQANALARKDNVLGERGIQKVGNTYRVRMRIGGDRKFLGSFSNLEKAIACRNKALLETHGDFAPKILVNQIGEQLCH